MRGQAADFCHLSYFTLKQPLATKWPSYKRQPAHIGFFSLASASRSTPTAEAYCILLAV